MQHTYRISPLSLEGKAAETEVRDGWQVVLRYEAQEKDGLLLIDLSHRPKWDIQNPELAEIQPWGLTIPGQPGDCIFQDGFQLNRMNRTQAACWHLVGVTPPPPELPALTDTTDATALMALIGGVQLTALMEKVCALDFGAAGIKTPHLFQAPVLHVASQVVLFDEINDRKAILIACARSFGQSVLEGLMHAGTQFGLHAAGELAFADWMSASHS
jgi:hypothetical protein